MQLPVLIASAGPNQIRLEELTDSVCFPKPAVHPTIVSEVQYLQPEDNQGSQ